MKRIITVALVCATITFTFTAPAQAHKHAKAAKAKIDHRAQRKSEVDRHAKAKNTRREKRRTRLQEANYNRSASSELVQPVSLVNTASSTVKKYTITVNKESGEIINHFIEDDFPDSKALVVLVEFSDKFNSTKVDISQLGYVKIRMDPRYSYELKSLNSIIMKVWMEKLAEKLGLSIRLEKL